LFQKQIAGPLCYVIGRYILVWTFT